MSNECRKCLTGAQRLLASGNLRYTRIPKTCVFVDSTFRFFLPCFVSPSSSTVTRVLNHAQMSFADVLLHGRTYRTPRIFSTTISKNAYPYTRSRTCCVRVPEWKPCSYVRKDDDHTATSTSTTRLFPWLP